ncbi:MAG: RDD family protein [SAR324 cluster bacterium]|nr:RDD family protein [SAR324 cluster bacterium]
MEFILLTALGAVLLYFSTKKKAPVQTPGQYQYQYAGFWVRFFSWIIDATLLQVVLYSYLFTILRGMIDPEFLSAASSQLLFLTVGGLSYGDGVAYISFLIPLLYFTAFESSKFQATPGKMLFGLKVTDLKGERISFLQALVRYFGHFLSAFLLGMGYVMIAFSQKKQGLHDHLAGTLIIGSIKLTAQLPSKKEEGQNLQSGFDLEKLLGATLPPNKKLSPWEPVTTKETGKRPEAGKSWGPPAAEPTGTGEPETKAGNNKVEIPTKPETPFEPNSLTLKEQEKRDSSVAVKSEDAPPAESETNLAPEIDPNDRFRPDSPHNPDRPKS